MPVRLLPSAVGFFKVRVAFLCWGLLAACVMLFEQVADVAADMELRRDKREKEVGPTIVMAP